MRKEIFCLSALAVAVLTACGGGGGSSGATDFPYEIALFSDKTKLPPNLGRIPPSAGVYASYTTAMTVRVARTDGRPVPFGTSVQCGVPFGIGDTAVLYRLDGKDEEDDDGNLLPSREISLETGSDGHVTFHLHALDRAGTALVSCSVTDPRDQRVITARQSIDVGAHTGVPSRGMPARIRYEEFNARSPGEPLGIIGNVSNLSNQIEVDAFVTDDEGQAVRNVRGEANLLVEVENRGPGEPGQGALLHYLDQPGRQVILTRVRDDGTGGKVRFSLQSGTNPGPIILRMTADRCDNDVGNGILPGCAITSFANVRAYREHWPVDQDGNRIPLLVESNQKFTFELGAGNRVAALMASGGNPPYTWQAFGLPPGLSLSAEGVLSGSPSRAGSYDTRVRVVDVNGISSDGLISIEVTEPPPPPPPPPGPPGAPPPGTPTPPAPPAPPGIGIVENSVTPTTVTASPNVQNFSITSLVTLNAGTLPVVWSVSSITSPLTQASSLAALQAASFIQEGIFVDAAGLVSYKNLLGGTIYYMTLRVTDGNNSTDTVDVILIP